MNFNISKMVYLLAARTREWDDWVNEKTDVVSLFLRRPAFVKSHKKEKLKEKKIFWRTYLFYTRTALQVAEPCVVRKHPCLACSKVE